MWALMRLNATPIWVSYVDRSTLWCSNRKHSRQSGRGRAVTTYTSFCTSDEYNKDKHKDDKNLDTVVVLAAEISGYWQNNKTNKQQQKGKIA